MADRIELINKIKAGLFYDDELFEEIKNDIITKAKLYVKNLEFQDYQQELENLGFECSDNEERNRFVLRCAKKTLMSKKIAEFTDDTRRELLEIIPKMHKMIYGEVYSRQDTCDFLTKMGITYNQIILKALS